MTEQQAIESLGRVAAKHSGGVLNVRVTAVQNPNVEGGWTHCIEYLPDDWTPAHDQEPYIPAFRTGHFDVWGR